MKYCQVLNFGHAKFLIRIASCLMASVLLLNAKAEAAIQFESVKPFCLIGSPTPVSILFTNESKQDGFLGMNRFGLPDGMDMVLINPKGIVLETRTLSALYNPQANFGDPGEMPWSELYPFKAGDKVSLSYDLDELFDLREPGKHKAQLKWGKTVLAETEVVLLASEIVEKKAVEGRCYVLPRLTITFTGPGYQERPTTSEVVRRGNSSAFVFIQCNLVVNKATLDGKELWFLNVEGNKVGKREASNLFEPLSVPVGTKIQKAEMDYKGQLWVSLEATGKQSLVIWNLLNGTAQSAIDWQPRKIEMGTTPRTNGTIQRGIVIAGIEGQTKISTLSYGVAPQAK